MKEETASPSYPRPSLRREAWTSLEGQWDYAIVPAVCARRPTPTDPCAPASFDGQIRVPFSPETAASGVGRRVQPGDLLWYRRRVELPELGGRDRLLLHFEAVDWRCWCYVNGAFVGDHTGGYEPFSFDITDALADAGGTTDAGVGLTAADAGSMTIRTGTYATKASVSTGFPADGTVGITDVGTDEVGSLAAADSVASTTTIAGTAADTTGTTTGAIGGASEAADTDMSTNAAADRADPSSATPRSFELLLAVEDPSDAGGQPRGKQRIEHTDIWYPPQSGIWQGVWMEVVPVAHLARVRVTTTLSDDLSEGTLRVEAEVNRPGRMLRVTVLREGWPDGEPLAHVATAAQALVTPCTLLRLRVPTPDLWSPDDPALYRVELRYGPDTATCTTAFRTATVAPDAAGIPRFALNGAPLMLRGVLYQPYWEGTLMTPPDADAYAHDLELVRDLGFNMVRVHASVCSERFYDLCDRLGILVCQDLVPGAVRVRMKVCETLPSHLPGVREVYPDAGPLARLTQWALGSHDRRAQRTWVEEACRTVERLRTHPSIVMWCAFNEGWGQFEAARVTELLRVEDPTRPIDATSGWYDQGAGDFASVHDYRPGLPLLRKALRRSRGRWTRAVLLSECGGLTWRVPGHGPAGEVYGYEECEDGDELARQLDDLRAELEGLWEDGLSGYVYTQLADVEQECNGLVTYDRAVRKV